jgi:hypothetical protein
LVPYVSLLQVFRRKIRPYIPDFKLAFDKVGGERCLHVT